jgi:PTS system N-acetylglucosamine-specific IIC component
MRSPLEILQPLGRALMLPIAVLPIASLMLRVGQPDMLDIAFIGAAGDAIFANLGLLFAIGVAVGFARDGNGAAALAGVVCFLVASRGAGVLITVPPAATAGMAGAAADLAAAAFRLKAIAKLEVPIGIVSGLIGGSFYNRYATIALPDYLAFFGGRRFVPIVAGLAGLAMAGVIGGGYDAINAGIDHLSRGVVGAGGVGLFAFGVLNRLLLVTGLHHVLNNVAWFVVGEHAGATGDLRRFFAGDPAAGAFMTGFFPVMMFGLPAACLAMYRSALPERRRAVGGMLLSLALTSFLTGVTEPIEFSFMFLAPILYALHAVLTGASMALMDWLGVRLGFGFSAGLFDYLLNFGRATRPWLLLPVGAAYFALYYALFRIAIVKLNLPTPGRDATADPIVAAPAGPRGAGFVAALGGAANLTSVDACTTRLRLIVKDQQAIDDAALKALGARGVIRPSAHAVQVVLGPIADQVAVEIRDTLALPAAVSAPIVTMGRDIAAQALPAALAAALGGCANIAAITGYATRLCVTLADPSLLDPAALVQAGVRSIGNRAASPIHLLLAPATLATIRD